MRLSRRGDGTLELEAEVPEMLPVGFRVYRGRSGRPELSARNPAAARRLGQQEPVHKALEALLALAPEAMLEDERFSLRVSPRAEAEQLQRVVRAVLQATQALARASLELALRAEYARQQARPGAAPQAPEGSRRREQAPLSQEEAERLARQAYASIIWNHDPDEVYARLRTAGLDRRTALETLETALQVRDAEHRRLGRGDVLLSLPTLALAGLFALRLSLGVATHFPTVELGLCLLGAGYGGLRLARGVSRLLSGGARQVRKRGA
jgi:hypothetical protein